MTKSDINDRADIFLLVSSFYSKIKQDKVIGPFFIASIPENDWEDHIEKLTDFWQTNLFFVRAYKGNPINVHRTVDKTFKYAISQEHFGQWLQLWFTTVDEHFEGDMAGQAKERARNIASLLFFKLYEKKI